MTESELKIIIAFIFKRSGKEEMTFSELYLPISMDLQWFNPNQAKELINNAIKQNLLVEKDSKLKPTFVYKEVNVPIGFAPSQNALTEEISEEEIKEEAPNILKQIVESIVKKTGKSEEEINQKIKHIAEKKNITAEVSAILLGKEYEIPLDDFLELII
jgi:hypothetical protein